MFNHVFASYTAVTVHNNMSTIWWISGSVTSFIQSNRLFM